MQEGKEYARREKDPRKGEKKNSDEETSEINIVESKNNDTEIGEMIQPQKDNSNCKINGINVCEKNNKTHIKSKLMILSKKLGFKLSERQNRKFGYIHIKGIGNEKMKANKRRFQTGAKEILKGTTVSQKVWRKLKNNPKEIEKKRQHFSCNARITATSWNAFALNELTIQGLMEMNKDISCHQETHVLFPELLKERDPNRRFFSAPAIKKIDPAAGTAIFLSKRASKCVESFGECGNRINWVRLQTAGPAIFVISVYIPHRHKINPSRSDTLIQLSTLLKTVPKGDVLWICMDANSRLKNNVSPYTGKYGVHSRADEGGNLIFEIMKDNDLTAINTRYQQNGNNM